MAKDKTMKFTILIILYFFNIDDDDGRGFHISHLNGLPLWFDTEKSCFDHINQNYNALQGYVEHYYKQKATVSEIRCVEDGKR